MKIIKFLKLKKKEIVCFIFSLFLFGSLLSAAEANWLDMAKEGGLSDVGQTAYNQNTPKDVREIVLNIISVVLGCLGVIFVVLLVMAGFKWMTAAGDEKKVEASMTSIKNSVIGLLIVLAAYSITYFVSTVIIKSTK